MEAPRVELITFFPLKSFIQTTQFSLNFLFHLVFAVLSKNPARCNLPACPFFKWIKSICNFLRVEFNTVLYYIVSKKLKIVQHIHLCRRFLHPLTSWWLYWKLSRWSCIRAWRMLWSCWLFKVQTLNKAQGNKPLFV